MVEMVSAQREDTKRRRNSSSTPIVPILVFLVLPLSICAGMLLSRMQSRAALLTYTERVVERQADLVPMKQQGLQTTETRLRQFIETAKSHTPITDKVTEHSYYTMYARYLMPFYEVQETLRMMEVGLGCDMSYGPGASVKLWKELFPHAEIWEAEVSGTCVAKAKAQGQLDGIHVLVGDQGNPDVLRRWVNETGGGHFDIFIDDGGHKNIQIKRTFEIFWPLLNAGGLYFIEDLQVGKKPHNMRDADGVMSDVVQDWTEQLLYSGKNFEYQRRPVMYPLPRDVAFVSCQRHACVIGKLTQIEKEHLNGTNSR